MRAGAILVGFVFTAITCTLAVGDGLPAEPIEIGNTPQFVFDSYIVDNHWAIKYKREAVQRVFHSARKSDQNPLLTGDQPSFVWVLRDRDDADGKDDKIDGKFRMWYQANERLPEAKEKGGAFRTYIAYAESTDGVHWKKPDLDLFQHYDLEPNNVVIARSDRPRSEASAPCILDLPEKDRRGYRLVLSQPR